jgi:hypothetical protein
MFKQHKLSVKLLLSSKEVGTEELLKKYITILFQESNIFLSFITCCSTYNQHSTSFSSA